MLYHPLEAPQRKAAVAGIPAERTANPRKQLGSSQLLSAAIWQHIHNADLEDHTKAQLGLRSQRLLQGSRTARGVLADRVFYSLIRPSSAMMDYVLDSLK